MNRTAAIATGTILIIIGLMMVSVSLSGGSAAHDSSRLLLIGGVLAFGGIIRVMTAFSMDSRRQRAHPADPNDPRWYGGEGRRQIAGRPCVECGRKITVAADGSSCDICSEPAHTQCGDQHRNHAHRPEGIGPFR